MDEQVYLDNYYMDEQVHLDKYYLDEQLYLASTTRSFTWTNIAVLTRQFYAALFVV